MMICMVMAIDRNGLIGRDGGMPWHLPSEMQYFKQVTMGKPMVMGRLTFESIGRVLPGRTSIVVTGNPAWSSPSGNRQGKDWAALGVLQAASLEQALELAGELVATPAAQNPAAENSAAENSASNEAHEVAVIGGARLCREAMPLTRKLYLTVIDHAFEGDTWLDSYNSSEWTVLSCETREADGYQLDYKVLQRKAPSE